MAMNGHKSRTPTPHCLDCHLYVCASCGELAEYDELQGDRCTPCYELHVIAPRAVWHDWLSGVVSLTAHYSRVRAESEAA